MSEKVVFEAWVVETPDLPTDYIKEPGNIALPWITESSEAAAGEALTQRRIGVTLAKMRRVRVTVETIEEGEG